MNNISYLVIALVSFGAFCTGALISGAETLLKRQAMTAVIISQPLSVLTQMDTRDIEI